MGRENRGMGDAKEEDGTWNGGGGRHSPFKKIDDEGEVEDGQQNNDGVQAVIEAAIGFQVQPRHGALYKIAIRVKEPNGGKWFFSKSKMETTQSSKDSIITTRNQH